MENPSNVVIIKKNNHNQEGFSKTMCDKYIPANRLPIPAKFEINSIGKKKVTASFDGGLITSDAGALLLTEADKTTGIIPALAACIDDKRNPNRVTHTIEDMMRQLVFLIASGYEDLNDSNTLRKDPLFKLLAQRCSRSGKDLASAPTLCRFENNVSASQLFKMGQVFINRFIESRKGRPPRTITIDLDATDDETYGQQEFSFYHGYYRHYCFLPLVVTASCNDDEEFVPVAAVLRPGNVHASNGAITVLRRIIGALTEAFPQARIIIRGDCGFALPEIYSWLEEQGIDYVIGMPRNSLLMEMGKELRRQADALYEEEGEKVRIFDDFPYSASTWEKKRRIIYKAESMPEGKNNRFLVTSIVDMKPGDIYDGLYVRRGEMENRIKELKNGLFMDRTSCSSFLANQLRVFLTFAAFLLFLEIRRHLKGTVLARAQVPTIRTMLLKIGARIKETTRRIRVYFSSAFPFQELFWFVFNRLRGSPVPCRA